MKSCKVRNLLVIPPPRLKVIPELQDENIKRSLDIRILWGRRKGGQSLASCPSPVGPRHRYLQVFDQPESWRNMLERRTLAGRGVREHVTPFIEKIQIRQSPITGKSKWPGS